MKPVDDFNCWIEYAERDLEVAKTLSRKDNPDIDNACYHCQQSAEKAMKAFLVYSKVSFKFIHDLDEICKDCKAIEPEFDNIKRQCAVLTGYITSARYPGDYFQINESDMQKAIMYAEDVLNLVKEKTGLFIKI
jgi:HEPN domain-containing protein